MSENRIDWQQIETAYRAMVAGFKATYGSEISPMMIEVAAAGALIRAQDEYLRRQFTGWPPHQLNAFVDYARRQRDSGLNLGASLPVEGALNQSMTPSLVKKTIQPPLAQEEKIPKNNVTTLDETKRKNGRRPEKPLGTNPPPKAS